MSNIYLFKPQKELDAERQFQNFAKHYKKLFSKYLLDKDGEIDLEISYKIPASMSPKATKRSHANIRAVKGYIRTDIKEMFYSDPDWVLLIKTINLVKSFDNKRSSKSTVYAFDAIIKGAKSFYKPWEISTNSFVQAGLINKDVNADIELVKLAKLLNTSLLTIEHVFCERKIFRNTETELEARKKKLPNLETCEYLASQFLSVELPIDVEAIAGFALLNYSPTRVSEIALLQTTCIHKDPVLGDRVLYEDIAKGGGAKALVASCDEFFALAEQAVDKLMKAGAKAREAADWYMHNPHELFIPEYIKNLRNNDSFSVKEAFNILGITSSLSDDLTNPYRDKSTWVQIASLHRMFVDQETGRSGLTMLITHRNYLISKEDLWDWVQERLPPHLPYADANKTLLLKGALFCSSYRWNSLTAAYIPNFSTCENLLLNISREFVGRKGRSDLKITTHQIRHFLNTIAQSRHLDQRLIALWSGRSSVSQNAVYDHNSPIDKLELINHNLSDKEHVFGGFLNDLFNEAKNERAFLTTAEFYDRISGNMHVTRIGTCRLPFNSGPCPKLVDCIDCDEHSFIKNDYKARNEVIKIIDRLEPVVAASKSAMEADEPGAKSFYERNDKKLQRYKQQIELHDDTMIEESALCGLPPSENKENIITRSIKLRKENAALSTVRCINGKGNHNELDEDILHIITPYITHWSLIEDGLPHIEKIANKIVLETNIGQSAIHQTLRYNPRLRALIEVYRSEHSDAFYTDKYDRCIWDVKYFIKITLEQMHSTSTTFTKIDELMLHIQEYAFDLYPDANFSESTLRSHWPEFKKTADKTMLRKVLTKKGRYNQLGEAL